MKTEEARQLADKALEELTATLGRGQSEKLKALLKTLARFHRYSWHNAMLIASQRPDATHVAGYRTWQRMRRNVKRGERAVTILAPMVYRGSRAEAEGDQKSPTPEEATDSERVRGFKPVFVFDIAQTDGQPLPDIDRISGDPHVYLERLKNMVSQRGLALEYSNQLAGADGMASPGKIVLRVGLDPANEFAVLAHELAHAILHHGDEPRAESRMVRETEAEATAFVVCQAVGLQTANACSDYIQLHAGTQQTLAASLGRIQRTAAIIIDGIRLLEEPTVRVAA